MQTIPDMLRHNETTWDISVSGLVRDARCWNMEEGMNQVVFTFDDSDAADNVSLCVREEG